MRTFYHECLQTFPHPRRSVRTAKAVFSIFKELRDRHLCQVAGNGSLFFPVPSVSERGASLMSWLAGAAAGIGAPVLTSVAMFFAISAYGKD